MRTAISQDTIERTLTLLAEPDPDDEIQREFLKYHQANPHVYKFLVRFAREALQELEARGKARCYGIAACVERARWHINFEVKGFPDFKLNNDYRARYARLIMKTEADLRGVFALRPIDKEPKVAISILDLARNANEQRKETEHDN
jgi:hypothetical protein